MAFYESRGSKRAGSRRQNEIREGLEEAARANTDFFARNPTEKVSASVRKQRQKYHYLLKKIGIHPKNRLRDLLSHSQIFENDEDY